MSVHQDLPVLGKTGHSSTKAVLSWFTEFEVLSWRLIQYSTDYFFITTLQYLNRPVGKENGKKQYTHMRKKQTMFKQLQLHNTLYYNLSLPKNVQPSKEKRAKGTRTSRFLSWGNKLFRGYHGRTGGAVEAQTMKNW